jgi:hypothetical protein
VSLKCNSTLEKIDAKKVPRGSSYKWLWANNSFRAAIISEKDLKELEKLRIDNDDGWAGAHEEIDYS